MNQGRVQRTIDGLRIAPFGLALITAIFYCIDGHMIVLTPLIGLALGRIGAEHFCFPWMRACLFPILPFAFHNAELLGAGALRPIFCIIVLALCFVSLIQGCIKYSKYQKGEQQ